MPNFGPALPHPEVCKVKVGWAWHLTLAGVLLSLALASSSAANNRSHPSGFGQVGIWEINFYFVCLVLATWLSITIFSVFDPDEEIQAQAGKLHTPRTESHCQLV